MTPEREARIREVVACRQPNLTVVLENVHDPHNIGAVLRSCDSVGIQEIFVLYTEPQLDQDTLTIGQNSSSGATKWIDIHYYRDAESCFAHVKKQYDLVYATHLGKESKSLYELDLSRSVALVFGNEKDGVSNSSFQYIDGNFAIPQVGMVKSLNISVACAVSLYEAYRQRAGKGYYTNNYLLNQKQQQNLFEEYERRHEARSNRTDVRSKT